MKKLSINLISLSAAAFLGWCTNVSAHGYISSPPGRAILCKNKENTNCGAVQYEPQSIEGYKGFPEQGPRDGYIASAEKSNFHELDAQSPSRWKKVDISSRNVVFKWDLTAQHSTTQWRYFITRNNWNPSMPLSRDMFEAAPFCQFKTGGALPGKTVSHSCTLPPNHKGYHVILGIWDVANTGNAFYQVIDANIKAD